MTMTLLPRETAEHLPVPVRPVGGGDPLTEGVLYSITQGSARPSVWVPPVPGDDGIGIWIAGLGPGVYRVFAKVIASPPAAPVIDCGFFQVT
jgi:hypothetical protein